MDCPSETTCGEAQNWEWIGRGLIAKYLPGFLKNDMTRQIAEVSQDAGKERMLLRSIGASFYWLAKNVDQIRFRAIFRTETWSKT